MEIIIKKGEIAPVLTWIMFVFKFLTRILSGLFMIDMSLWTYANDNLSHQLFSKTSYFSKDGAAILIKADGLHVGRFEVFAAVITNKKLIYNKITNIYNDRKYVFSIERRLNSWIIMVDDKFVEVGVKGLPLMTFHNGPRLNTKFKAKDDININYYERNT